MKLFYFGPLAMRAVTTVIETMNAAAGGVDVLSPQDARDVLAEGLWPDGTEISDEEQWTLMMMSESKPVDGWVKVEIPCDGEPSHLEIQ